MRFARAQDDGEDIEHCNATLVCDGWRAYRLACGGGSGGRSGGRRSRDKPGEADVPEEFVGLIGEG